MVGRHGGEDGNAAGHAHGHEHTEDCDHGGTCALQRTTAWHTWSLDCKCTGAHTCDCVSATDEDGAEPAGGHGHSHGKKKKGGHSHGHSHGGDEAEKKGWFARKMEERKAKQLAKLEEQRKATEAKEITDAEEGTMICDYKPSFDGAIAANSGDVLVRMHRVPRHASSCTLFGATS